MSFPAKTKNRKYITYSDNLAHDGYVYEINSAKSGVYSKILHSLINQLDICQEKWKRVLVIRFDLHQQFYTGNNKYVSRFIKNLLRRLQRQYEIREIGYVWARELERSKCQHYHFSIYLDGNVIRHSSKVLRIIEDTWKCINPDNHVPTIKNPYYFVDSLEKKKGAVYRLSYLAKARGKGYRDKHAKDFSTSRLSKKS